MNLSGDGVGSKLKLLYGIRARLLLFLSRARLHSIDATPRASYVSLTRAPAGPVPTKIEGLRIRALQL
jgi:hypothetical protein